MEDKRAFRGIWIPKEIWLSKDLTLQEKVFIVEILLNIVTEMIILKL